MSTQAEVEVSYGVSNDFFRLWLDERMNYTCALFEDTDKFSDRLEDAQDNKLKRLSRFAHVSRHTESVLDIGCGWGANLEYQATVNQVPVVHGFTLSAEQHKICVERDLPNTKVDCENYLNYKAPFSFDAAMCIGMIEHVVTPEQARAGKAVEMYRDFFRRVHSWTKPGTHFALQSITRCQVPRKKADLDDLRHSTYTIFPGAVTPRVEDLVVASIPYYEVVEMHSMRFHYKRTCELWRQGIYDHKSEIVKRWSQNLFDDYDRYLSTCIRAFDKNWQSLHQFSLRRLD